MRILSLFVMVVVMTVLTASQTLPAPEAITDPKQIASKPDARVEKNLSIEKLYMTRQVGGATWSPDGKTVTFVSNLSGRNNLWLVASEGGWPMQLTVSDQRQPNQPGRRMASGSPTCPITTATSSGIFFWSRRRPGKSRT
jgi:hypothetical protein